jgi:hypothetical protein
MTGVGVRDSRDIDVAMADESDEPSRYALWKSSADEPNSRPVGSCDDRSPQGTTS